MTRQTDSSATLAAGQRTVGDRQSHDDRRRLPGPPDPFRGRIGDTFVDSVQDWPSPVRPPGRSPNLVVVMFDDLGFGQLSCFGGPIPAPHVAALAAGGLRYTNFHTTSLCSPSRAALMTGRNHHSVGFATISEMSAGFPGHNAFLPRSAASIAEVLRLNGYSTFCVGKWHLTPTNEATAAGPFDHWPLGMGFERYYGFMPGETSHWHPALTEDNHRVPVPERDGYHLSEDLADHAISFIRDQQQVASGRPFFLYLPFGAVHSPFHAPPGYMERFAGHFDEGWDRHRQRSFERQKQLGIVPEDNELPPRNPGVKQWEDLDRLDQMVGTRLMEAFAGMAEHADAQIGRLGEELRALDILDDTVIMVLSDNGASQEGGRHGVTNTERFRNLTTMTPAEMAPLLDLIGGPETDPHYPAGWAMAGNSPFRRWKRDTHRGGNTDPLIVHWPAAVTDPGGWRPDYLHITDVYPTLLDLAGLPVPEEVNGFRQQPVEGRSFAPTLRGSSGSAERTQYYEMLGSRAIYRDGWMAVTWHRPGTDWADDPWELYDQRRDYTQAWDLAGKHPDLLEDLIGLWWREAAAHRVLPLDDRGREQRYWNHTRPSASQPRPVYRYYPGTSPIPSPSMPPMLNRPHRLIAHLTMLSDKDEGVVYSMGGRFAGRVLLVETNRAVYLDNNVELSRFELTSSPLPVGQEVAVELRWTPTGRGRGNAELYVDGRLAQALDDVATAVLGSSHAQEGFCIGRSWGTPVAPDRYSGPFAFPGHIRVVELHIETWSEDKLGIDSQYANIKRGKHLA